MAGVRLAAIVVLLKAELRAWSSPCSRWTRLARRTAIVAALLLLCAPAVARANGDPASDYLLVQSVFLPFNAKVDRGVTADLADTIREAGKAGHPIKVAVLPPPGQDGGGSETRDRITIAAGITALLAPLAAVVFFRRGRTARAR